MMTASATHMPKIMIVDDDPLVVHSLAQALRPLGKVSFTTDYEMVHVTAALSHPEVLLLDVDLPGVTGLEIARRIRANPDLDGTCVILMTAHDCGAVLNEAKTVSGGRVLLKPIDLSSVAALTEQLISEASTSQLAAATHH